MGLSSSTAQFSTWPRASFTFTYTCTCGFAQSTSVTMPVSVVGLVSSNFAEMAWCAAPRSTATTASAVTTASTQRRLFMAMPSDTGCYCRLILNWPVPRGLFQVPVMPRLCMARFSIFPSMT